MFQYAKWFSLQESKAAGFDLSPSNKAERASQNIFLILMVNAKTKVILGSNGAVQLSFVSPVTKVEVV